MLTMFLHLLKRHNIDRQYSVNVSLSTSQTTRETCHKKIISHCGYITMCLECTSLIDWFQLWGHIQPLISCRKIVFNLFLKLLVRVSWNASDYCRAQSESKPFHMKKGLGINYRRRCGVYYFGSCVVITSPRSISQLHNWTEEKHSWALYTEITRLSASASLDSHN